MENIIIKVKGAGLCGNTEIRNQLNSFVEKEFDLLYVGAVRRGENIPEDSYARERIQINHTRLHAYEGLKIAGGHHWRDEKECTDEQLRDAIADIQLLIDAATEDRPAKFALTIEKIKEKKLSKMEKLLDTVADIQLLLDEAAKDRPKKFVILKEIMNKEKESSKMERLSQTVLLAQKLREESKENDFYKLSFFQATSMACNQMGYDDQATLLIQLLISTCWNDALYWSKGL